MNGQKHRLLVYQQIGRQSGTVFLLALILVGVGVFDRVVQPILGGRAFALWLAMALVLILWFYYAILVRRSFVQVTPEGIRLQGPLHGADIPADYVLATSASRFSVHYPYHKLKGGEKGLLKPIFNRTSVLVELSGYPHAMRNRKLWFPRFLFATTHTGLLCAVEDWMGLSQDVEKLVGVRRQEAVFYARPRMRTLAQQVLEAGDFD